MTDQLNAFEKVKRARFEELVERLRPLVRLTNPGMPDDQIEDLTHDMARFRLAGLEHEAEKFSRGE